MTYRDALIKRINELVKDEQSLTNACLKSGITPSTLFDFINGKTKHPSSYTIKKLCVGLEISLKDFYARPYFENNEDV